MTKVFVSHSSRTDPFAAQVRDAVKRGLGSHEVFVDMDVLQAGDMWRSVLYHWLAECHAAVVLLNREALASSWVHREVNVLLWRQALGAPILIIPAILGDLTMEEVEKAGLRELEPLQFARITSQKQTKKFAEDLASEIVARFGGFEAAIDESPMGEWTDVVSSYLHEVKNVEKLVAAARELGVDDEYLPRVLIPREGCRFLASQMLASTPERRLFRAISKIDRYTPIQWLSRLIEQVSPTWVNGEAARGLLSVHSRQRRTVLLNARLSRSAKHYVLRATCCASSGYRDAVVSAVAGEAFIDEFKNQCRQALSDMLNVPPGYDLEDALPPPGEEPDETGFLIVDPAAMPLAMVAAAVREVQETFPWLVVVLLTGETMPGPAELADAQLVDALILAPILEPNEELTGQQMVGALKKLADKQFGMDEVA